MPRSQDRPKRAVIAAGAGTGAHVTVSAREGAPPLPGNGEVFVDIAPGPEAPEWEPDLDWDDREPDPYWEPEPADLWKGQAIDWLLPGRQMSPDPDQPGRFSYANPAAEALADFMSGLDQYEFGEWFAMAMRGALFLRRWLAAHRVPWPAETLLLILLAVQAISPEPGSPGRPDDAIVRVPAAPLVRAHAILTAAPPCSPAPVLAGTSA